MNRAEYFLDSSRDEHQIYTYKWEQTEQPKAIIQIVHGAGEYANRYDTFAKVLVSRGFVVYSHDHRGHGKSVKDNERFGYFGEEDGFRTLVEDTYEVTKHIKAEYPDKKLFVLGHSMGSFVARYFAILYSDQIDGLLVVGTGNNSVASLNVGIKVAETYIRTHKGHKPNILLDTLIFKAFDLNFIGDKGKNAWLSRDKESREAFNNDAYCGVKFTSYAFRDMFTGVKFVTDPENVAKIRKDLPIFMLSGDKDPVGGNGKMVKKAYDLYKNQDIKSVKIKLYKDMRHEILNEIGKQEVYKDIIIWINRYV